jgi:LysM domain
MEDAMSDAVVWGFVSAPARMPPAARPPLRLVGPNERVCLPAPPATRITGRGRLVVALVAAAAVVTLAVVLASSVDATAAQIDHATTVTAGQTLSDVAATQLPSLPINDAIARIQLVNGLNTSQVRAGQSLLIPAMP